MRSNAPTALSLGRGVVRDNRATERQESAVKIPKALRLWWHDGAGVRVLRYSGRQWTVQALVSFICTLASLIPVESFLGRSMLVVVPYLLVPAGLAAAAFAITAAVLTHRFRRTSRG